MLILESVVDKGFANILYLQGPKFASILMLLVKLLIHHRLEKIARDIKGMLLRTNT